MRQMRFLILFVPIAMLVSCTQQANVIQNQKTELLFITMGEIPANTISEDYYVPAYSNLYYRDGNTRSFFTVVLSLRNVSHTDTVYFTKADYIDTRGGLVRSYIDSALVLRPMETAEYIVEQAENQGGSGANFIVSYSAQENIKNKPMIETVMIGSTSHHGFAFRAESVLINP